MFAFVKENLMYFATAVSRLEFILNIKLGLHDLH